MKERVILVPKMKKLAAGAMAAVIASSALVVTASADEPYTGYGYDWWGDPIPSQNGYVVDKVVSGPDMGVNAFGELTDMFVDEVTGDFYLVDSKNDTVVVTNEKFDKESAKVIDTLYYGDEWSEEDSIIDQTTFNSPSGIFVTHKDDKTLIYVADFDNDRVVAIYPDGEIWMEYTRPSSDLYDAEVTFNPSKVVVDNAYNVYVVIKSITMGAVQFSMDGTFNGYYGANRVEQTAEVIANAFWKMIMTREQIMKMKRAVSVEISNVDIDEDGFIYTVTENKNANTDVLKKMNPAGTNIFTNLGYDEYTYGDYLSVYYRGKTYESMICDVDIDSEGNVLLLDFATGRVFQYNEECELLFIFGGLGTQKGTFTSVTAVESYNGKIYVTDSRKNSVTVFKQTEFGGIVHEAMNLFDEGLYTESKEPWEEVLRRDANYWLAYIGLGNAYLQLGEFETAMDYFYYNSRGGYNRAFKDYRINFIRENFTTFIVIIAVVVLALIVLSHVIKRRKAKKGGQSK